MGLKNGRQCSTSVLPRIFKKDVLPVLGKRSIYAVKRPDLLEVIARTERRKALSVAGKVRTWFNQMFRYALIVVPGLEQNPASDLDVVAVPLPPVNHNPFLHMPELPKLLQRLHKYRGLLRTQLGLRLLFHRLHADEIALRATDHFYQRMRLLHRIGSEDHTGDKQPGDLNGKELTEYMPVNEVDRHEVADEIAGEKSRPYFGTGAMNWHHAIP